MFSHCITNTRINCYRLDIEIIEKWCIWDGIVVFLCGISMRSTGLQVSLRYDSSWNNRSVYSVASRTKHNFVFFLWPSDSIVYNEIVVISASVNYFEISPECLKVNNLLYRRPYIKLSTYLQNYPTYWIEIPHRCFILNVYIHTLKTKETHEINWSNKNERVIITISIYYSSYASKQVGNKTPSRRIANFNI